MNTKGAITACMLYIGVLVVLSQGWVTTVRKTITSLSGS